MKKGLSNTVIGFIFGCFALFNFLSSLICGKYVSMARAIIYVKLGVWYGTASKDRAMRPNSFSSMSWGLLPGQEGQRSEKKAHKCVLGQEGQFSSKQQCSAKSQYEVNIIFWMSRCHF